MYLSVIMQVKVIVAMSLDRHAPPATASACGLAFPDLGDEVPDGRESEVRAVTEDGVARAGKAHQAGGFRWQLAGQFLDHGQRADRVVLAGQDQHGTPDGADYAPGVEGVDLVSGVVQGDVCVLDHPGL